jgi:two-component system phosphate regulon sensor histidine kinase PhoR
MPEDEPPSQAETRRYVGIIAHEAERLGVLVDDLLALARADAHELRLEVRPVAVGEVVEEVYQTLEPLAHRERQVTLVRQAPAHLPPALADRDRLAQVLLNLVRNAITYTPEGGIVSIALEQPDPDHLALTVSDTGAGIAPEDLERVFERFYRTDVSRSRATGGSGLGLSIVRDLVEAMGGAVSATSTPGEGSRFRVTLRVAAS